MTVAGMSIRLERRLEPSRAWSRATPLIAAIGAIIVASLVLLITGHAPISTFQNIVQAALTNQGALSATLVSSTPLVFTGLAAAVAFRSHAWNIGGEGQLYIGAVCAAAAGIALGGHGLGIALPAMIVAGVIGGGAWGAVPGVLRAYCSTNEILTSLMFNYVAGLFMSYLIFSSFSYWRDTSTIVAQQFPQGKTLPSGSFWPQLDLGSVTLPLGFILAVAVAAVLFVLLRTTRFWFQINVMSASPEAGRYAGIRTRWAFVVIMGLSGALAGLAGASQIGDFSHTLDPPSLQAAAFGYTGIVVAALARYNPLGVVVAALCLGGVTNAGFKLQGPDFPLGLVGIIEGVVLFCVLGSEMLSRRHLRIDRVGTRRAVEETSTSLQRQRIEA